MPIAIQAPKMNRIRAFAFANPELTAEQIAQRLGIGTSAVKLALSRPMLVRKKKTFIE